MELGLGFADDDFKGENKEVKNCLTSYNAKICHRKWFMSVEGDDNESRANIKKHQGDYYYGNKQYQTAAQCYTQSIGCLSSQNRVMRREMIESLARCYCYVGDQTKATELVTQLISDATTTDNMVQALFLKQQILKQFGNVQEEIKVLQQLLFYHPYNVQFWLRLVHTYKIMSDQCHSEACKAVTSFNLASCNDLLNTSLNFSDKLEENLTLENTNSPKTKASDLPVNTESLPLTQVNSEATVICDRKISTPASQSLLVQAFSGTKVKQTGENCSTHLQLDQGNIEKCQKCFDCDEVKEKSCKKLSTRCPHEGYKCLFRKASNKGNRDLRENCDCEHETTFQLQLKLLTCCIRTRLLLRSVQGTIGSFIKIQYQEHLSQVEQILHELAVEESIVEAATEHITRDVSIDTDEDEETGSQQQHDNMPSDGFEEKWFGWIKNI